MIAEHVLDPSQPLAVTYRFGRFFVDSTHRVLMVGSERRPLSEKVFQVLLLLLEANGHVVEKRTFFDRIWPNDASDANLAQHIFLLRTQLGEAARQNAYVITVSRKGYRLAVPIERKNGLTMKATCEDCGSDLGPESDAYICSYECTFCASCSSKRGGVCPNCGGEQVRRPRRTAPAPAEPD